MLFFYGMMIIVLASIAVVYKTLTAYTSFSLTAKVFILIFLTLSWFSPMWIRLIRKGPLFLQGTFYELAYHVGYFMMAFVLILTMLLIFRDLLWHLIYFVARNDYLSPNNAYHINVLNAGTLIVAFLISLYGVYEAHRTPIVQEIKVSDHRVKEKIRFVAASDFHINQSTPEWHIKKMIDVINAQNPDYILLVGDVVDDKPEHTIEKFKMLSALKAKKIYVSLGNHEYYNRPYAWMIEFSKLGFEVLHNSGEQIGDTGVYVGGVPDAGSMEINYLRTFEKASDAYKILLSHSPTDFKDLDKTLFDMQISGHTHGGQIFPFQYITKKANDGYLAGLYKTTGADLFVMRGAGYWGPPVRIGAIPEILVLDVEP